MTVKELMEILKNVDPNLPVICDRYSDFMEQEPPEVIKVIKKGNNYLHYYPNQWEREGQPPTIEVLHFKGN